MNIIAHAQKPAFNISDKLNNENDLDGENLLLNSINRGLAISHCRKKGKFYRTNSCTVFNSILSPTVTSAKLQPVKNFNALSNLFSCDIC